MVAADVRRRILARKTLPPRYLGGYASYDDSSTHREGEPKTSGESLSRGMNSEMVSSRISQQPMDEGIP